MNKTLRTKKMYLIITFISVLVAFLVLSSINTYASSSVAISKANFLDSLKPFFKEYKLITNTVIAMMIITNILIFIYHFCKLGAQACSHPLIRKETINNIMISGVCLMLTGASATIYAILYAIVMK